MVVSRLRLTSRVVCSLLLLTMSAGGCHSKTGGATAGHAVPGPAVPLQSASLPGSASAADAPAPASSVTTPPDATRYADAATGVSFFYPAAWKTSREGSGLASPSFESRAGKARVSVTLYPLGSAFASTNLAGLTFSYAVKPGSSVVDCQDIAANSPSGTGDIASRVVNGLTFSEGSGSDAGMCHTVSEMVDTTLHNAQCLVFERDFETECPDVSGKGTRELTTEQRAALQGQINAVMGSVAVSR